MSITIPSVPETVSKRDGRQVPFDPTKIEGAILKCLRSLPTPVDLPQHLGVLPENAARLLAGRVVNTLRGRQAPQVEAVQDLVEDTLMGEGLFDAARHYIRYRAEHEQQRAAGREVDAEARAAFDESAEFFEGDPLRLFMFYDKYARFDWGRGRRETWIETVDRSIGYLAELAAGRGFPGEEFERLRRIILTQQAMPSMRLLATAGPAARRQNVSIYNCFAGTETFLTPTGPTRFVDAVGQSVRVCTIDGAWRTARVEAFGEQETYRITFKHWNGGKSGSYLHNVVATQDHRWLLLDGTETTALRVGDKLAAPLVTPDQIPIVAVRHGFTFGDGTITRSDGREYGQVRLCGKKALLREKLFDGCEWSAPPSYGGDPVVYLGAAGVRWKSLPDPDQISPEYVAGFILGLGMADGSPTSCGNLTIYTQEDAVVEWLKTYAPLAGCKVLSIRTDDRPTNYGDRSAPLRSVLLGRGGNAILRVERIEHVGRAPVFCVVEPETRTFTLGNGQITGNCSYLPIADLRAFEEILLISMAGCGVGYSVEGQYVYRLPFVRRQTGRIATHVVEDSTEGWGAALLYCITAWFEGDDVELDTSRVRPAGAVLRTKGGRASGPGPLRAMLDTIRGIILRRQGAMLRPLDAHDIACAIGGGAVSGGHRRTAMISLFDFDDDDMRRCKDGDSFPPIRWNANNSAVWPEGITQAQVMRQMLDMAEARRGEPGIFNRDSATRLRPAWRKALDLGAPPVYGTNPCGEIVLRPFEFCNLSIAVARAGDGFAELADKVVAATILGTLQSLAVHFPGLREDWARNCSEERLLGVDVTGQADCPAARDPEIMRRLRGVVEETNLRVAALLGIPRSAALTCNKPSGNSSQFLGCASGIHARYAPHYLRRCRVSAHSPVYKVLRDAAVPMTPENGQSPDTADTWVVAFPVAAPEAALLRRDVGAIEQCRHWLRNKTEWTHHNPSCTVYYRPDELLPLTAWIWEHREAIGGLSFFPVDDARYEQPPYEEIDAATFERLRAAFPVIDWSKLVRYEDSDATTAAQELACAAGACEIDLAGRVRSIAAE